MNGLLRQTGTLETTAVCGAPYRHRVKIAAMTQMRIDFAELGHGKRLIGEDYPFSSVLKELFCSKPLFELQNETTDANPRHIARTSRRPRHNGQLFRTSERPQTRFPRLGSASILRKPMNPTANEQQFTRRF